MLLDDPIVSRRLFHPRPTSAKANWVVDVGHVPGEVQLACHKSEKYPGANYLVHFHGNGELASEYVPSYAEIFHELGVNVLFVEYRGYGQSTGTPQLAAMLPDGEKVVQSLGVDPSKIVVFGRSIGSLYAVELVHRVPSIAGLVIESGIATVAEKWGLDAEFQNVGLPSTGLLAEIETHFDQRSKMEKYRGHVLILHAEMDRLVDPWHGQHLCDWSGSANKQIRIFSHGNHNTIFSANYYDYLQELRSFLGRTWTSGFGKKD